MMIDDKRKWLTYLGFNLLAGCLIGALVGVFAHGSLVVKVAGIVCLIVLYLISTVIYDRSLKGEHWH